MQGLRQILLRNQALAGVMLALALFVRALVPAGYMATGEGRSITVTLCADASGTPKTVAVPLGQHDAGQDSPDKHKPCAFAGMGLALDLPAAIAAPAPRQPAPSAPFAAQLVGVGQGLAAPPPYQTGPPATV